VTDDAGTPGTSARVKSESLPIQWMTNENCSGSLNPEEAKKGVGGKNISITPPS